MFIPLGTDRLPQRRIIGTPILIGLNMAAFLAILLLNRFQMASLSETIQFGAISRSDFHWWGLITSQFIHDPNGLAHLGFNMLFLWVFGQAVESRLGAGWFITFYLLGGIFSGHPRWHCLPTSAWVLQKVRLHVYFLGRGLPPGAAWAPGALSTGGVRACTRVVCLGERRLSSESAVKLYQQVLIGQ